MKRLSGILLVLALSGTSYAWWSVGAGGALPSTHYRITTSAIELIRGTNDYPDITKFAGTIIGATSGFEDDAIAHGKDQDHPDAGKYNGGDFERWWRESKASYNRAEFLGELNAYYRIGSMAHLVEDHAVPAHAANVYHGNTLPIVGIPANPDDLEHYADGNGLGPRATVTAWYTVKEPLAYYYDEQNMAGSIVKNTQKKLPNWTWPGEWNDIQFIFNRSYWKARQYWYKNDWPQYQYTGQAFGEFGGNLTNTTQAGGWGYYGGTSGSDFYEYDFTGRLPVTDAPGIVQDQLDMAAAYSAGMLMAVSKSLPPIVKDLSISEPNLCPVC